MKDKKIKGIIDEERAKIEKLQDPNLLSSIINEVQKAGVVGEEDSILALTNKVNHRLVKDAHPTSENVIVSDRTGSGKDYIVTKTCEVLVPKEKYFHRTDISDKAFDYWQPIKEWVKDDNGKDKPVKDSWNGYVLHLEDPQPEALNGQSFKVMSSGGTSVTKVIDHVAKDIKIDGKPIIIVTSLGTLLDNESMRRWATLRIDTTTSQTRAINKRKLSKAKGESLEEKDNVLIEALQKNLFKKEVVIPYADKLFEVLPENLLSRTQTDQLLDSIRSSAVLHQYQRKKHGTKVIEANGFDLGYGWFVFTLLNNARGIPTNRDEEELIKILISAGRAVTINELAGLYTTHTKQWIYNNKEKMTNKGLIRTFYDMSYEANREIEYITVGDNAVLVLKDFKEVLKMLDREGFNAFNTFIDIYKEINRKRLSYGLARTNSGFFENLPVQAGLKPLENRTMPVKTKKVSSDVSGLSDKKDGKKLFSSKASGNEKQEFTEKSGVLPIASSGPLDKRSLHVKISEVKEYIAKVEASSNDVSMILLLDHFDKHLISKLYESGQLIKKPNGNLTWG
ncbi:MAG: hypothetical protein IMZ43_06455 [Thermoplasmata archaeon]|nr:hypothetical protein [Thermoplasmata archaeon]